MKRQEMLKKCRATYTEMLLALAEGTRQPGNSEFTLYSPRRQLSLGRRPLQQRSSLGLKSSWRGKLWLLVVFFHTVSKSAYGPEESFASSLSLTQERLCHSCECAALGSLDTAVPLSTIHIHSVRILPTPHSCSARGHLLRCEGHRFNPQHHTHTQKKQLKLKITE